ncbi:hypothetical protein R70006_05024 [Paraburkholderia domus]|uniref:hypothetical protein n=1 Tax=Paraburkholderia domus TaxID=2793075 RepID=UPI0019144429|nr:hypothetical protein [Paraburkholderia domus]MBK5051739.1 hypothetical protein [Burkholderia sp. R-70006]CAE6794867.1 hypothetical protein R70006_05024 [Paraburkholderia domus]
MSPAFRKATVCTVLFSVTGLAVGSGCPAVVDSIWESGMSAAQGAVASSIVAMVQSVEGSEAFNAQRVQGALRVLNEQINTSSNNSSNVVLNAKQATANLQVEIDNRTQVMKAIDSYGPSTGQGFDPCGEQVRSQNVAVALGEASNDMQEKVTREIDAAPGRFVSSPGAVVAQRLQAVKSTYCTADEAKAGLCAAAAPMAGMDVSGANFFTSATAGSAQDTAKSAMLNNLFGVPDQALGASSAQLPAGQAYLDQKRSKDAIASVAAASLKTIQAWTSSRSGSGTDTQSVMDALASKVDTYAGGPNYDSWAQTQATQSQRGLLLELAKMLSTELYEDYLFYQSGERQEAIAAARVALHASDMPTGIDAIQAASVRSKVAQ